LPSGVSSRPISCKADGRDEQNKPFHSLPL
jgi:hypothetical protein